MFAISLLAIGFLFSLILLIIISRDRRDRDINRKLLEKIGSMLSAPYLDNDIVGFFLTSQNRTIPLSGGFLLKATIVLLMAIDIIMAGFILV